MRVPFHQEGSWQTPIADDEPWVMFWRYLRALSDLLPPQELSALLERVFLGRGLYLYAS